MRFRRTSRSRRSSASRSRSSPDGRPVDCRRRKLALEALEPRWLLAVFSVDNIDDANAPSASPPKAEIFDPQQVITAQADGGNSVYAADLDGDGDLDVLSASYNDDKIAWYENQGGGSLGPQQVITTQANGAYAVYAADLNGDGELDVLSASSYDDKIAWYQNLGGGSFTAQQVITTQADEARSVYAADLDGDGDLDVLSASRYDDKIAWYENRGGGSFGPHTVITTEADRAQSVYAADLDGDGDLDVLSASENDGKIAWYENQGNGRFGLQQVIATYALGARSVHATDLDDDGDLDVLSLRYSRGEITWYENLGDGSFGPQQVITSLASGARSVYAADLDGDGDQDVLSASYYDDKIAWYENQGGATFGAQQVITTQADGASSVYAADLDGDGDLDVLSASYYDDKIAWYENLTGLDATPPTPDPSTWQTEPYATGETSIRMTATAASDINGVEYYFEETSGNPGGSDSGWQDSNTYEDTGLVSGTIYTYRVKTRDKSAIQNEGQPSASRYAAPVGPPVVHRLEPADDAADVAVDTDLTIYFSEDVQKGAGNIVIKSSRDDTVVETILVTGARVTIVDRGATIDPSANLLARAAYYVEIDSGAFEDLSGNDYAGISDATTWNFATTLHIFGPQQVIITQADRPYSVYTADLDGDGDPDVLSASSYDDKIAWHENQGGGTFGPQQVITTEADDAFSVRAADLDGDGDQDVLSASENDDKIAWYENLGGGSFTAEQVITTQADGARSVYTADLDGDGDLDVLSASYSDDKIAWYENRGGGRFTTEQVIITQADGARSVYAADLDGDGDQDVLSASYSDDKIAWYENLGGGGFAVQRVITTQADEAMSVYAADLDGDGDQDVLSASENDDKIAWYENLGGGSFAAGQAITTQAEWARCVYAADLDGDGDQDVLSASENDDKIAWYENLGGGSFAAEQVITTQADGAYGVHTADLDGDGDLDVLSASPNDDKIAWYENFTGVDAVPPAPNPSTWQTEPYLTGETSIRMTATPATDISGVEYYFDEISGNPGGSDSGWQDAHTYEDSGLSPGTTYTYQVKTRDKSPIHNEGRPSLLRYAATVGPPRVRDLDPPDDATEVAIDTDLVIDFSEAVQEGMGNIVIRRSSDGAEFETIAVTSAQVTISGNRATINPNSDLGARAAYHVQVDTGAFEDLDGNDYAGINDAVTWNFATTVDIFGPQQVISGQVDDASSVYAADLDGDGDLDVLSASSGDDKIAWYENLGDGNLAAQQVITTQADAASSVYAADLNGDGELDVLSASVYDDKIAWYENLGGGSFAAERVITTQADGACSVHTADLDGDGDLDVLSASGYDGKIAWYENFGDGSFAPEQVITTQADYANSVHAADLDGDRDLDVLSASASGGKINWYENLGDGIFADQRVITTEAGGAHSVSVADLDGDGDLDVLSASMSDDKIAWYENLGDGSFGPQQVITTQADSACSVHAADLDGDGDLDVLSASYSDDKIAWYENLGGGSFGTQRVITAQINGGRSVYAADLDGDGDLDVVSAGDYRIAWHKNLTGVDAAPPMPNPSIWQTEPYATGDTSVRMTATAATDISGVEYYFDEISGNPGGNDSGWQDADTYEDTGLTPGTTYTYQVKTRDKSAIQNEGRFSLLRAITAAADVEHPTVQAFDPPDDATRVPIDADLAIDFSEYVQKGSGNIVIKRLSDDIVVETIPVSSAQVTISGTRATIDRGTDLTLSSTYYVQIDAGAFEDLNGNEYAGISDTTTWNLTTVFRVLGPQQVITDQADGANAVYAADLDGDGDQDVLSASSGDDKIAWYENQGGGNLGPRHVITTEADGARSVYAADLDGDGDQDVLSASEVDDKIAWYENLGSGRFGPQQVITTQADGACSVYAADLNGDGYLDVLSAASASFSDDKIAWYGNRGDGSFGSQAVITTQVDGASSVYTADLDGDGDQDVLSTSSYDDKIAWYENRGGGSLGPQRVITTQANGPRSVYAADLDEDGDLDLLSASFSDDKIAWYENLGEGSFGPQTVITTEAHWAVSVHAADLDGDGDPDVLSASADDDKIAWYENRGGGSFDPQTVITTEADYAYAVFAADLDGDGDSDVLSASMGDDKIAWYENLTNLDATPPGPDPSIWQIEPHAVGDTSIRMTAAPASDISGVEYYFDEVSGNPGGSDSGWQDGNTYEDTGLSPGTTYVYQVRTRDKSAVQNEGTPSPSRAATAAMPPSPLSLTQLSPRNYESEVATDTNLVINFSERVRKGAGNIVIKRWSDDAVVETIPVTGPQVTISSYRATIDPSSDLSARERYYVQVDVGAFEDFIGRDYPGVSEATAWNFWTVSQIFGPQQVITSWADGAHSVYAADLDGDGDPDVLSASVTDDKIAWYENLGGGSFTAQQVITSQANGARSVYAADLDGDGDLDVLSGSAYSGVAWHENLGDGSFATGQVIAAQGYTLYSIYAADLDRDGDVDVLAAFFTSDTIAWYENLGGGSFADQQEITTQADGAESVYAADLDGDGDLDVLSASLSDDKIAWYQNLGGGNFAAGQAITTQADGVYSAYAADLDGDGDPDVLSASRYYDKIAWYENLGDGSFGGERTITLQADDARSVYAADLDGDGDLDVLSASNGDDKIAWYENLGGGSFSAQQVITTQADEAYSVYAVDLDDDGDLDVLSASSYDRKIAWYENLTNRDAAPPKPDPSTWKIEPHAMGESSIRMTATAATDLSGVEYFFDEISGNPGGSNSGWQESNTYEDTGLWPDTTYAYQVITRDKSAIRNEGRPSRLTFATTDPPPDTGIVARHIFYNNSAFDGNDPAAGAADDQALATDKEALLPGGSATFVNYTSFSRGINGIMVDAAGLAGTLTAADFEFRAGNDDDPANWDVVAAVPSVDVRAGAGVCESDRVTIIFGDNVIQKQWLQVTVLANENTGLAYNDVFYYGNAVGESGNSAGDARVNAVDVLQARNNPRTLVHPAPIDCRYDYNRDRRVNASDMLLARQNQTHLLDALRPIRVPDVFERIELVENGGFETGDFTGWNVTPTAGTPELAAWAVGPAGSGFFFDSSPREGTYSAYNGFDGEAGLEYVLSQDVTIPDDIQTATLKASYRIKYGEAGSSTEARVFRIEVRDTLEDVVLVSYEEAVLVQGPAVDLGWNTPAWNLSAHRGKTVTLRFHELVPENYTGPAIIELDDISLKIARSQAAQPDVFDFGNAVGDDLAIDVAFAEEADGMLSWLYELEEMATQRRASDEVAEDAVDLLLAGM